MPLRKPILIPITAVACALAFAWPKLSREDALYHGRFVSDWVRDALDYEHWQQTRAARAVVISELRGRAVPFIIPELEAECHSHAFYAIQNRLLILQNRLPYRFWLLKEPNPVGKISAAAFVLSEMGEPAAPAAEVLARTLRQSAMHCWESQDVMTDLISMGPVAKGALPHLRILAADKLHSQSAPAAFAIYAIEGNTNILTQVVQDKLRSGDFAAFDRQIFWFRNDERLNQSLLPMLCKAVSDPAGSAAEREAILFYLGAVSTTNSLPRATLEQLLKTEPEGEVRTEAEKALHNLCKSKNQDE